MMATRSPRDGSVTVAGLPWLARMIDKSRLTPAEKLELDLDYPCPMDKRLLEKLGLDGDTFQKITTENDTDEAVVAQLQAGGYLNAVV